MRSLVVAACSIVAVLTLSHPAPAQAQEIETETARLLKGGMSKWGTSFEFQTSKDGQEYALPLFFEAGLHDRLELVIEPVALTAIRNVDGTGATGTGALELTLVGLALKERWWFPATALAAEVKFPTTLGHSKDLIDSGKFDFTAYLILSKRFWNLDVHFNFGYTVIGRPTGIPSSEVHNTFDFALAARYYLLGERLDIFAEFLAQTKSLSTAEAEGTGASSELGGAEYVGALGVGYKVVPSVLLSLGVTYDNHNAWMIRPSLTVVSRLW